MPQPKAGLPPPRGQSSIVESNGHLTTTAEALEAIARVLFRKGLLTRAEVSEEIEMLKTAKVESVR